MDLRSENRIQAPWLIGRSGKEGDSPKGGPPSKPNNHLEKTSNWEGDPPGELTNGIVDLVTFVWYFSVLFFERDKEKMTFASECYKLVVVIALLRISIWEVRWKTGAFKSRLFLPIWDTPPSHDNHSASTKDGFSIDFRTYRDLLFH
ncbi:hypothetical protein ACJX0J_003059 (mitochondrion) [Zea mays]